MIFKLCNKKSNLNKLLILKEFCLYNRKFPIFYYIDKISLFNCLSFKCIGCSCQPITGYSYMLFNYDKPHPDSKIRKTKLASIKANAARRIGGIMGNHDQINQTVDHHPPKCEKSNLNKLLILKEFYFYNRKFPIFYYRNKISLFNCLLMSFVRLKS